MFTLRKAITLILSMACGLMFPSLAGAQWAVIDVANLAQTYATASESVKQNLAWAKDYAVQYQMLLHDIEYYKKMLNDIKSGNMVGLKGMYREAAMGNQLYQTLTQTYSNLNTVRNYYSGLKQVAAYSSWSMNDVASWEKWREYYKERQLDDEFGHNVRVMESINEDIQKIQALQQEVRVPIGQEANMQAMNQHLNIIAGQNAQVLAYMAQEKTGRIAYERSDQDSMTVFKRGIETDMTNSLNYLANQRGQVQTIK
jgi:conjugal transfer/entry exclusion protein